ncbi:hypothetical protein M9H77_22839 [Catharanthus roseus]|uniref:Uncharacterized protein n=1 Tax=Catharanthus roseus TaxID=4058 RepID=A0ACC0ASB5_CATRO|nr:hypothetical protein M9H77_22839 [Catharanthus roseus]
MDLLGGGTWMLPKKEGAVPAPVDVEGMDTLAAEGSPSGQQVQAAGQWITELREEISRMDALCYTARQAHRQATSRSAMLEGELVQGFNGQCLYRAGILAKRYEDALRVTFAAFRLCGMANDWWFRAFEAWALKNQSWTWIDFQEEFKREYIPRWGLRAELQRALAPLQPMRFAAAVEAATRTEMAGQAVTQKKAAIGSAATPYKRPVQDPRNLEILKDPVVNKGLGMRPANLNPWRSL